MHRDKFPETVPFRLTRMLVNAMEVRATSPQDLPRHPQDLPRHPKTYRATLKSYRATPSLTRTLVRRSRRWRAPSARRASA